MDIKTEVIGAIVLGIIGIGLVLWYMSEHPAPYINHPDQTAQNGTGGTAGGDHVIKDNGAYYDIKAVYPAKTALQKSAGAAADAKAIEIMKQFEMNSIAAFKENGNFANLTPEDVRIQGLGSDRKYSLDITYTTHVGTHTVSYVFMQYMDTLGAHPNGYYRTFTFNSKTGAGLVLGDLFTPNADYLATVSKESRRILPAQLADIEGVSEKEVDTKMINDGTTPDADNFQNWYIEKGNLVLIFPQYQVAPYVAGPQEVYLPLSSLQGVNASYK